MKTIAWPVPVLAVVLAQCAGDTQRQANRIEEAKVKKVTLTDILSQTGEVRPIVKVEVKPEASGKIEKLYVKDGQRINKGDTILTIDPSCLYFKKQQLDLSVRKAQIQKELAERDYKNLLHLEATGTISAKDLQDRKSQAELASIAYEQQLLDLRDVTDQLSKTTIRSPMTGVITALPVEEGEIVVSAVSGMQAGTTVATIADISHLEVISQIGEADYVRLRIGQRVNLQPEAIENASARGTITFISLAAKKSPNEELGTFEVRISVDSIIPGIAPGINVNVEFVLLEKKNVLGVPYNFVERNGPNYSVTVRFRGPNGSEQRKRQEIKVGMTDYKYYEVISGLSEGDVVIITSMAAERRGIGQNMGQQRRGNQGGGGRRM